jgi:hypothetical protein
MKTPFIGGALYFLIFIDDFSRYTHIYFLQKKSAVLSYFNQYKSLVETHTSKKILILCSDNGGEFTSKFFNKICIDSGIQRHLTNPYNPSQNGVSERKNRTLIEFARSMLHTAQLSNMYWAEAVFTACYLQNCSYTSALDNTTPFELWTGIKPNISHLRIFGCKGFSHIPDEKCTKLEVKSTPCIFVGYGEPLGIKGYRLYNPETHRIFSSRDVIFEEDSLLSKPTSATPDSSSPTFTPDNYYLVSEPVNHHQPPAQAPQHQPDFQQPQQLPDSPLATPITPRASPSMPSASTPPTPASTQLTHGPLLSSHMISHLKQNSPSHLSPRRTSTKSTKGQNGQPRSSMMKVHM